MTKARVNADNASADIQGVTAGTGLTGGGTSGTVTLTNGMATAIDAKGDLVVGTGADTFSRLAVGSTGDTIVADSSTTTGLRWQGDYAAGKNKIINGDFSVNQRAFSSTTTPGSYGFDRWWYQGVGSGTLTYSAQTFTLGAAPVSGYEGTSFARLVTTSQSAAGDLCWLSQRIESIRTFAGQTVTVSFWAKAASGTPKVAIELEQNVGTGGSPSGGSFNYAGQITLSTSWVRYSVTVTLSALTGAVLGTNNNNYLGLNLWVSAGSTYNSRTGTLGVQNNTFDFWGVQVEAGSVATAFQTATGSIQGELAACQRYYYRAAYGNLQGNYFGTGIGISSTRSFLTIGLPVSMRTAPSFSYGGTPAISDTNVSLSVTAFVFYAATTGNQQITLDAFVASGATQFRPYFLLLGGAGQFIELSAEL